MIFTAEKKIRETKPLSEFLTNGRKIEDIRDLLRALRLSKERFGNPRIFFPGLYSVEAGCSTLNIKMSKKNGIDAEGMLGCIVDALQEIRENIEINPSNSLIIEFRYKKFSTQFLSGHLERDEEDNPKPMHAVSDYRDRTVIRRLKVLREATVENRIDCAFNEYSYEDPNKTVGYFGKIGRIKEEDVARDFGFKFVLKESEGIVPNGKEQQRCKATRICIYKEEYQADKVKEKAIETLQRAIRLRNDVSFSIGINNLVEIYVNSKEIKMAAMSRLTEDYFRMLTEIILRNAGVKNFNDGVAEYVKREYVEDSELVKFLGASQEKIYHFFSSRKEMINYTLAVLGFPLIFAYLYILQSNTPFEAVMKILPAFVLTALLLNHAGKEKRKAKLEGGGMLVYIYGLSALAEFLVRLFGFPSYLYTLGIIVAAAIVIILMLIFLDWLSSKAAIINNFIGYLIKGLNLLIHRFIVLSRKPLVVRILNGIVFLFFIGMFVLAGSVSVGGFTTMPIIVVVALFGVAIGFSVIAALLDKQMWREVERERERLTDGFFTQFRKDRMEMTDECIVRFDITSCKKLRNPIKGLPTALFRYARSKYPKALTLRGIIGFGRKAIKANQTESQT